MPVERDSNHAAVLTPVPRYTELHANLRFYNEEDTAPYDPGVLVLGNITSLTRYSSVTRRVAAWEAENEVSLRPNRYMNIGSASGVLRVPSTYNIRPMRADMPPYFKMGECPNPHCDGEFDPTKRECPSCHMETKCESCLGLFISPANLGYLIGGKFGCRNCYMTCNTQGCEGLANGRANMCYDHTTLATCVDCDGAMEHNPSLPSSNQVCYPCIALHCTECGERSEELELVEGHGQCPPCATEWYKLRREDSESDTLYREEVLLTSFPNRPIRLVSIEQEFQAPERNEDMRVGDSIAYDLHGAGLSNWPDMMRYHCGTHGQLCHVESDSSVAYGGELILNRLRLDDPEDAAGLMEVQEVLDKYREAGSITFDVSCGTHIHADLHGYTIQDARNLVIMYSHLEDVIFRFGSAGYQDHRSIINNSTYARPIHKGTWNSNKEFGIEYLRRAGHEDSLNMEHFYKSLKSCTCGAIEFGTIAECECVRPKCTAEWRVFNGTSNPNTIMAYVSFVQSITAWCQGRTLDASEWDTLSFEQGISFVGGTLQNSHTNLIDAWRPRVRWIFENLQFSSLEHMNILNTMKRSPLRYLGEDFFEDMRRIEPVRDDHRVELGVCPHRGIPMGSSRIDMDEYCYDCDQNARYCECGNYDTPEIPLTAPRYTATLQTASAEFGGLDPTDPETGAWRPLDNLEREES